MMRAFAIPALVLALLAAAPARAEELIVSMSPPRHGDAELFGEELVLFGSVEKDANTPAGHLDLVVTVSGPRADMVTRRKRAGSASGCPATSRQFLQVPAYLAIFSNQPIDAIASPEVQRRQPSASTCRC